MRPFRFLPRALGLPGLGLAALLAGGGSLLAMCGPWPTPVPQMTVEEYEPKSTLVVPGKEVKRSKFPFIDVHNHQDRDQSEAAVAKLVSDMDGLNMKVMVNLSGGQGEEFVRGLKNLKGRYPKRFVVFANLDFTGIDQPGWGEKAAAQLEKDVKNGAQGLKIFKNLGMTVKDSKGARVPTDDPRIDPVWDKCAELGIPVLIHTAEPASFFEPQDKSNERWLELKQFPRRARPPSEYPSWETLIGEQHHVFRKHPKTKFIDAHLGWMGETSRGSGSSSTSFRTSTPRSGRFWPRSAASRGSPGTGSSSTRTG